MSNMSRILPTFCAFQNPIDPLFNCALSDTIGHSQTLSYTLRHSGTRWDTLGHSSTISSTLRHSWTLSDHSGTLSDTLGHSQTLWGLRWYCSWYRGLSWFVLVGLGCSQMVCLGLFWSVLVDCAKNGLVGIVLS